MSEKNNQKLPFELLGKELKRMRIMRRETLDEVSGAVEIESDLLIRYEDGSTRPSEDILSLLISYFDMKESESNNLWKLSGYENQDLSDDFLSPEDAGFSPQPVVFLPMDSRIVYTDLVHVMVNNYGVVINFMQGASPNTQALAVSRIGMSKEHAQSLLEVLKETLEKSSKPKQPKQITPGALQVKKQPKKYKKEN